jgi:3-deoxy-manno-octulosonate cytidylyltransferase (CMP-KDO synthetase)
MQACNQHGVAARLTSTAHRSGTDRVNEIAQEVFADVYLNIQGDEPLVAREHIDQLVTLMQDESVQVGTLKTACAARDIANPNAVKVVTSADGRALYFSRATIPYARDASGARYFKHLGFYAYRRPALEQFCLWPESPLERSERLEQLRFLENGISIHVAESPYDTIGVDTEDDLRRVEEVLAARK